MTIICVNCQVELLPKKNGFAVEAMRADGTEALHEGDELIQKYGIEDHIPARWPRCETRCSSSSVAITHDEVARLLHAKAELVSQRNDLIHDLYLMTKDRDLFRRRYLVAGGTAMVLACFAMGRFLVWVAQ